MSLSAQEQLLVGKYASQRGVSLNACLAFMKVETGMQTGTIINGVLKAIIRWEGHYFDRLIPPALQAKARALKLASPKVGGIANPASQVARYLILDEGKKLDVTAAISSCSWGVGQVMGAHWKKLGFPSAEEFERTAQSGFSGQLAIMFAFMDVSGVIQHLRRLDWSAVARIWNGAAYAKNKYDVKMKEAYEALEGAKAPAPASAGMIRVGSKGAKVRELQGLLVRAGYAVTVDGDYGGSTERAVRSFQARNHLDVDGVAGPQTMQLLATFKSAPEEKVGQLKPLDTPEVKQGLFSAIGAAGGTGAVKSTIDQAKDQLTPYVGNAFVDNIMTYLTVAGVVVLMGGLAYAGYGLWKKRHSSLGIEDKVAMA
jgi:hypothetical protein